jgi:acetyltransferase-like isoleucine patch superfamily enzyme
MKILLQLMLFIFPWTIRRRILNNVFRYQIHPTAKIGFSIILSKKLRMNNFSKIGNLTFCSKIDLLQLDSNARIGSLNYITGYPTTLNDSFSHISDRKCELIIEEYTAITSRHFIDCTAGVYLGKFTTLAGIRSQILTHAIDLQQCRQDAQSVRIGSYCFIGTGCIFLKGSILPNYSVLGAGSMLNKSYNDIGYLYGGVPAKKISEISYQNDLYFSRQIGYVK